MIVILLISLKRESGGGGVLFKFKKGIGGGGSFHFRKIIECMYIGILLIQIRKIS